MDKMLSVAEAISRVEEEFPFPGLFSRRRQSVEQVVRTVRRFAKPSTRILDFGAGSCDKVSVLQTLGYQCSACDDLNDPWHRQAGVADKIKHFAKKLGIDYVLVEGGELPFEPETFDIVMMHDVIEHLHDSPREIVLRLVNLVKPNGLIFVTVPNAVNIKKRIRVLSGRTNYPPYDQFYWWPGAWRGHVREYVLDDLRQLALYQGLELVDLRGCHHMTNCLPALTRFLYSLATSVFPNWRDSLSLVARKPRNWEPVAASKSHESGVDWVPYQKSE